MQSHPETGDRRLMIRALDDRLEHGRVVHEISASRDGVAHQRPVEIRPLHGTRDKTVRISTLDG